MLENDKKIGNIPKWCPFCCKHWGLVGFIYCPKCNGKLISEIERIKNAKTKD